MEQLKNELRRALVGRFGVKESLNDDTALFSGGLIDSLSVMDLVCLVEEQLGCPIPPAEITLENFDSINRIIRFGAKLADRA
jgi:acyl carrier protein